METTLTGPQLIGLLNRMEYREKDPPTQPSKCTGCIWGRWDGLKQYCMWQKCKRVKQS